MKRSWPGWRIAPGLLLLVASLMVAAPAAHASVVCGEADHHWSVYWFKYGPKLANVDMHIGVCVSGWELVQPTGTAQGGTTSWADPTFKLYIGTAYRAAYDSGGFDGGYVRYRSEDWVRECLPTKWIGVCTRTLNFFVRGQATMKNALYFTPGAGEIQVGGRVFDLAWSWGSESWDGVYLN